MTRTAAIFAAAVLGAVALACCAAGVNASEGFNGKRISYMSLPHAVTEATLRRKPIMLVVHKSWCNACKQLRAKFEGSAEIEALAEYFVMANAEDDDEPAGDKYAPHGSYSPRLLFLAPDGELLPVTNPALTDPQSPHFYGTAEEVVRGMVAALHHTSGMGHVDEL